MTGSTPARLAQRPVVPRPTPIPRVRSPLIDRLAPEDLSMFWERIATNLPLVEETDVAGEVIVTFCWGDHDAEQVLLFAHGLTDETNVEGTMLERLPGTDLWHASFLMGSDWRGSYGFVPQYPGQPEPWDVVNAPHGDEFLRAVLDHAHRDRRNRDVCRNRAGIELSVAALPDAPSQSWLDPRPTVPHGSVTPMRGPDGRNVWIYDPAGTDADAPLPAVVALDGEVWTSTQDFSATLDNLIADEEIPPVRACLLSSGGLDRRWADHADRDRAPRYIATELIPWLRDQRGLAGGVTLVGQGLGGLMALRAGLMHPESVFGVVSHSASLWADDLADLIDLRNPVRIYLAHGTQEWALEEAHESLAGRLIEAGLSVDAVTQHGGHDYAWWRGGIADGLISVLGSDELPRPRESKE